MKLQTLLVATAILAGACQAAISESTPLNYPKVIIMNSKWLATAKSAIEHKDPAMLAALAHLIEGAESALTNGPFTVMSKTITPPSNDKHDYMSLGPYWWPDPNKKNGLPYIRRDGELNPANETTGSDRPSMGKMARTVDTLALAYYFTGSEKYAARAALLLQTWFLNADTLMNPHLNYGQAIPGKVEGRGIGIIDTVSLPRVVDAAELLTASAHWTDTDHQKLKHWFRAYLLWLQTSPHGQEERDTTNNHGTWYDVQVACFALFVGDRETAKKTLQTVGENRIAHHIAPDGRQAHELARTRSLDYSTYNLEGMFSLAKLGEQVGVDLWHYQVAGKPALKAALSYLTPYADAHAKWPHPQITKFNQVRLLPLLRQGVLVYGDSDYLKAIQGFSEEVRTKDRSQLAYPIAVNQHP